MPKAVNSFLVFLFFLFLGNAISFGIGFYYGIEYPRLHAIAGSELGLIMWVAVNLLSTYLSKRK